jgi:hypothetical protein
LDFESACLAKRGRFDYDWVNDPKGGAIMSLKGFYKWGDTRFVYLKEFYTGLRYRVPRDKAYVAKSQDGVCVLADKKDATLGWEGGSL